MLMARVIPSTFSLYNSYSSPSFHPPFSIVISSPFFSINPRFHCNATKKPSFVDQILDYIEGGPKLRKWYGAPELLPKDGSVTQQEDDPDVEDARDAILVTDGDSDIGQEEDRVQFRLQGESIITIVHVDNRDHKSITDTMVILSLIVKRAKVKALVKDRRAALEAFGTYVESFSGDANDKAAIKKALKGVRAVICPNEGFLSKVGNLKGVQHVILLSQLSVYKGADGIQALVTSNARKLAEQDESTLRALGIPYTIIRTGSLLNSPGGTQGFSFQEGVAARGSLSKEDASFICVEALESIPDTGLIIEVANGEEKVSDWKQFFAELTEKQPKTQ